MIKNYIENANFEDTGFAYTLSLISGKHKMVILYCLMEFETVRFNELKRYLKTISDKTLSTNLKELEADKLNEKLTEVQKLSAQIITLQRQKDECQKHVDAARQAFNSADRVLNELKNSIVNYESLTANEKENIRATMDRVTPHILWEGWNTEWENSPLSFIDRLTQATRNYQLAQEKQRELKSTIALIHKELEGININKESIDAAFPDWRLSLIHISEPTRH